MTPFWPVQKREYLDKTMWNFLFWIIDVTVGGWCCQFVSLREKMSTMDFLKIQFLEELLKFVF